MPGGDAADDFAEAIFRKAEQALERMLMQANKGFKGPRPPRPPKEPKQSKAKAREEARAAEQGHEVYDKVCELYDQLKADEPGMPENELANHALEGACAQVAPEIGELGWPEFEPGAKTNRKFDLKTVDWDPDATMMKDALDNAGIPYKATQGRRRATRFEVQAEAAGAVEEICDAMCKTVNGMSASRFTFQKGFSDAPLPEKRMYAATLGAEEARIVCGELEAQGIEYTASQTGIDGMVEVVATVRDPDKLARAYRNVAQREVAIVTPEQAETMQRAHDARSAGNRARQQERARAAQRNTADKMAKEMRNRTPARDQRAMERSARERAGQAHAPKRTIAKGGK